MKDKERLYWIREGNKLWNEGKVEKAEHYFTRANYQSGLIRVAEHYLEQNLPLKALLIYSRYKMTEKVEEMYQRMAMAISKSLEPETKSSEALNSKKIEELTNRNKKKEKTKEKTHTEKIPQLDALKMKRGDRKGEIWHQLIAEIKSKRNILLNASEEKSKKDKKEP